MFVNRISCKLWSTLYFVLCMFYTMIPAQKEGSYFVTLSVQNSINVFGGIQAKLLSIVP